jgi:hypothetical protein
MTGDDRTICRAITEWEPRRTYAPVITSDMKEVLARLREEAKKYGPVCSCAKFLYEAVKMRGAVQVPAVPPCKEFIPH